MTDMLKRYQAAETAALECQTCRAECGTKSKEA